MFGFDAGKFVTLRRRRDDRRGALQRASEEYRDAYAEVQRLEGEERHQRERYRPNYQTRRVYPEGGGAPVLETELGPIPTPGLVQDLVDARAVQAEAQARVDALQRDVEPLERLVHALEAYLRAHAVDPKTVRMPAGPDPAPSSPTLTIDQLVTLRADIRGRQTERRRLKRAAVSEAEAHARIDTWIEARAGQLELTYASALVTPTMGELRFFSSEPGQYQYTEDRRLIEALFATTAPKTLRTVLRAAAAAAAKRLGGWGPSVAERTARLAELDGLLWQLERQEEDAITGLEGTGVYITRRADADPRAVLSVAA